MSGTFFGPLRIWDEVPPRHAIAQIATAATSFSIETLACQEILRPTLHLHEPLESFSLAWYQELERLRYHRHGRWIPKLLEFAKYRGERLLGLGVSLGSDLVNFARQGAEVVVANASGEQLDLIRRNFELRNLPGTFLHANSSTLPIDTGSIDVVYLTGLLHDSPQPATIIDEIFRVLKPGGKLLAVVPARSEIDGWIRFLDFFRFPGSKSPTQSPTMGLHHPESARFDRRDLRALLGRFQDARIYRRHLRRADVPHLCRWLPLGMLERLTGRLFLFKGLKPVSAGRSEVLAA